jgi:predicted component of type VI protein secretion system
MNTGKPHMVRLDTQDIVPLDRKLTVGRHPDCDYVVTVNDASAGISGRHASIEVEGEYAWIADLGSTNGTWVRGARIAQRTPLLPGERFLLDRLEFEFRAAVQVAAPSAPVAEKTVFAGRHAGHLPPVPVSREPAMTPTSAALQEMAPTPPRGAPVQAPAVATRLVPERRSAATNAEAAAPRASTSRPTSMYIIAALGLLVLAGAGIALLLR